MVLVSYLLEVCLFCYLKMTLPDKWVCPDMAVFPQITESLETLYCVTAVVCAASESWPTSIGRTFLLQSCQVRSLFCLYWLLLNSNRYLAWHYTPYLAEVVECRQKTDTQDGWGCICFSDRVKTHGFLEQSNIKTPLEQLHFLDLVFR